QRAAPNNSRIEDCWSSGTVTGFNNAGGIVGQNQVNTYIRRCYSTAIVSTTGTSTTHTGTGGIAGLNASAMTDAITGCVALNPSITSATTNTGNKVHRVSGTNSSAVGLSHNLAYSNMILTNDGAYTPDKGADKVDGEDIATLPVQGNYVALGWDFSSVWKMVGLYPALQWQKGTAGITADFNYGDITINGSDGSNVIYKDAARSPNSVTLSVGADYTAVKWYIDGAADPTETGNAITLNTANYSAKAHSITFTGTRGGVLYAQVLPFTVKN
ncbi:MAG: hypothetical protein LBT14_08285, partial [Treponema sp.]|nr:hypothetical protein [Treponema sp.]